jgi:tRNA threonylcarbamoyladenosine biosynthesis protein TsaE
MESPAQLTLAQLNLANEAQTITLAEKLAALAIEGDVFALAGTLGTGKSVFARAFITARNGSPLEVPSPTFTLVQPYELESGTIHHFDLYRLSTPDEVLELGLEDAFASGITLIEWPDRAKGFLPLDHMEIRLVYGDGEDQRSGKVLGGQAWKQRWEAAGLG